MSVTTGSYVVGLVVLMLQPSVSPQDVHRQQNLGLLRQINSTQAHGASVRGRYLALSELAQDGALARDGRDWRQIDSYAAETETERFNLVVSADGKTYAAQLESKAPCGGAFFTDATGRIYEGRALGCVAAR